MIMTYYDMIFAPKKIAHLESIFESKAWESVSTRSRRTASPWPVRPLPCKQIQPLGCGFLGQNVVTLGQTNIDLDKSVICRSVLKGNHGFPWVFHMCV